MVLYGFFGCSGGILFFNLFLERIITFLAWILRSWHMCRLRKRLRRATLTSRNLSKSSNNKQRSSLPDILDDDDDDDHVDLDQWKPSVYWVMLYLSATSCTIACCAAALYASLESWDYFDALYCAFVSFTTIGFGDFVSAQKPSYPHVHWYRFANFILLVVGCCCIYSLLNVTSIVIKQGLNYVIHKLQYGNKDVAAPYLPRRQSSVSSLYYSKRRSMRLVGRDSIRAEDATDAPRRMSGELICMKDFTSANKVSLAVMQKQLYDAAQKQRGVGVLAATPNQVLMPGAVGPLAIASEKFESKATINR